MKKFLKLVVTLTVVTGLMVVAWYYVEGRSLNTQTASLVDHIAEYYADTITEDALPLRSVEGVTSRQKRVLGDLQNGIEALTEASVLHDKVIAIQSVQRASHVFLQSVEGEQEALLASTAFKRFSKNLGELGAVRKHLQRYNDLAVQLNERQGIDIDTLTASVNSGSLDGSVLTLLYYNGQLPSIGDVGL